MTEPDAGSDLAGIKTRGGRGDHWLLNGSKTYISNGQIGDLFIVRGAHRSRHARTDGLVPGRTRHGGLRARPQSREGWVEAQDTSELFFANVKVPKANVLGDPGEGLSYLTTFLAEERLIARRLDFSQQHAFDITLDYIKQRKAFGRPIARSRISRFAWRHARALERRADLRRSRLLEHNAGRLDVVTPPKPSCCRASSKTA